MKRLSHKTTKQTSILLALSVSGLLLLAAPEAASQQINCEQLMKDIQTREARLQSLRLWLMRIDNETKIPPPNPPPTPEEVEKVEQEVAKLLGELTALRRQLECGQVWAPLCGGGSPVAQSDLPPPSMVYPDVKSMLNEKGGLLWPSRDHRLSVPSSTPNAKGAQVVELRGWIRGGHDSHTNTGEGLNPYDWRYELELDPAWTDQMGIDLNRLVRIGNIFMSIENADYYAAVAPPTTHIEIMSWRVGQTVEPSSLCLQPWPCDRRPVPNPVWPFEYPLGSKVFWAWDPRTFSDAPFNECHNRIRVGQYVRIVGALITDSPHWESIGEPVDNAAARMGNEASRAWGDVAEYGAAVRHEHPDNPSRWIEIHPPDRIELISNERVPTETVRCVAVLAKPGQRKTLDHIIPPPGPRPPGSVLGYSERVSLYTNVASIVEGNFVKGRFTGAALTPEADGLRVRVTVAGTSDGPGKFNATYRVYWKPAPPPGDCGDPGPDCRDPSGDR